MRSPQILSMFTVWLCGWLACAAPAADATNRKQDEQAIRAAAKQYVEALARKDSEAMHALWVDEGDIVDHLGQARSAHEVIEEEARAAAKSAGDASPAVVNVTETSIRFLTDEVAIEDGRVEVATAGDGPPEARGRFTAIWVKQDGQWRLASLREARVPSTVADELAGLDWMVGNWTGEVGKAKFDVTANWNQKQTLLERDLKVTLDGKVILNGGQRIGVDPLTGQIKSWMHDSDGGYGEGIWTKNGNAWIVQASGVTPDGRRTRATNIYTHDGKNQMTWKSTGGFSDGRPVADFEIKLVRPATPGQQQTERQADGRNP